MMTYIKLQISFWTVCFILAISTAVCAETISLQWDPSPSPGVVGYKLYYTSETADLPFDGDGANEGSSPIDVGSALSVDITGLSETETHYFTVTAYDAAGYESSYSNIVSSGTTNRHPELVDIENKTINEGSTLSFTLSASDPDNDDLTYSAAELPVGASLDKTTGVFNWTPGYLQSGTYNLSFSVSDGSASDSEDLVITVVNTNQAPVLAAIGSQSIYEGTSLSFSVNASDFDDDNLSYSVSTLPPGASFNPTTRTFNWAPNYTQSGSYTIDFSVNDGSLSDEETLTITVLNSNQAPVLEAIGDKSIREGKELNFRLSGSDPDGDSLNFTASALPDGATFNPSTRAFSWTPRYDQQGSYDLGFKVSDGRLADSETLTIEVVLAVPEGLSLPVDEIGLAGVDRVDGLNDADNYVDGMPKADVDFLFRVLFRDFSDIELPEVYLLLNNYAYPMEKESGDVVTGATYVFTTRLGPAAAQYFHFETRDTDGTILSRFPVEGEFNGPQVELLNGKNVVGVPGNSIGSQLTSGEALGTSLAFRWIVDQSTNGSYALVDGSDPVAPGEGYVIKRTTEPALLAVDEFGDNPDLTYVIPVERGWNLIANPYGGNVDLSEIQVQQGNMPPMSWDKAAAEMLVIDGVYYYGGNDWGNQNIFISNAGEARATLIPHLGYWIYINSDEQAISLSVPKPQQ